MIYILLLVILAGWFIYSRYNQVLPDAAVYFLDDAKIAKRGHKVLVFSPHPDDETIGAGGYIYRAAKEGADVYIVLVTDGNKHHLKERRYDEFKKATSTLGVSGENLIFLDYSDGCLKKEDFDVVYKSFRDRIDLIKPDFVVYPHINDSHPDHAQTGKIVQKILNDQKYKGISYQYLIHHRLFPQPKKYDQDRNLMPPISLIHFDKGWFRFILDDESIDQKTRAVFTYKSQLGIPFLRSLILSSIRKNELFSLNNKDIN